MTRRACRLVWRLRCRRQCSQLRSLSRSCQTRRLPLKLRLTRLRPRAIFWQGPYVGANLGYQWGLATNAASKPSGVAGGLQSGYSWQIGSFVFGGETDLQLSDADHRFAGWKFSNPWFGTLRARAGIATGNLLFYGTVGLAYGTLAAKNPAGVSESRTSAGWAAGAGVEVALMANWTARAEYFYVDLNDLSFVLTGANHGMN